MHAKVFRCRSSYFNCYDFLRKTVLLEDTKKQLQLRTDKRRHRGPSGIYILQNTMVKEGGGDGQLGKKYK